MGREQLKARSPLPGAAKPCHIQKMPKRSIFLFTRTLPRKKQKELHDPHPQTGPRPLGRRRCARVPLPVCCCSAASADFSAPSSRSSSAPATQDSLHIIIAARQGSSLCTQQVAKAWLEPGKGNLPQLSVGSQDGCERRGSRQTGMQIQVMRCGRRTCLTCVVM